MFDSQTLLSTLVAGLAGLVLGGLLAERATELAALLVAWGTVGGFLGAGWAALTRRSVTRWTGYGGLLGVGFAILIAVFDALFFRA